MYEQLGLIIAGPGQCSDAEPLYIEATRMQRGTRGHGRTRYPGASVHSTYGDYVLIDALIWSKTSLGLLFMLVCQRQCTSMGFAVHVSKGEMCRFEHRF